MKVAIMQPYLFPYIGYYQLLNWADVFVLYTDAQFIKGGWINRNYLRVNDSRQLFNLSLEKASTFSKINSRKFDQKKFGIEKRKLLKTLSLSYCKAPYFGEVYPLVEDILDSFESNLSASLHTSFIKLSGYLGINAKLLLSEHLDYDRSGSAQDKVIDMCRILKATHYTNPAGGKELYDKVQFASAGIELSFISAGDVQYEQSSGTFMPGLSIIDVLMHAGKQGTRQLLNHYQLS